MILYTSENNAADASGNTARRTLKIYAGITVFCVVVFLVYDQFSHGVRSPYMTWLFVWPLVFGCGSSLIRIAASLPDPDLLTKDVFHTGVMAMTLSSLLRGIFEIAGTASDYQKILMGAGIALAAAGLLLYGYRSLVRNKAGNTCV